MQMFSTINGKNSLVHHILKNLLGDELNVVAGLGVDQPLQHNLGFKERRSSNVSLCSIELYLRIRHVPAVYTRYP